MVSPAFYLELFNHYPLPIYGVGTGAYRQLGPASYLKNYRLWCYRKTSDLLVYRKAGISIDSFQEYLGRPRHKVHNLGLLKSKTFQKQILDQNSPVNIFLVKSTPKIEALCQKKNWKLLTNPIALSRQFEHKKRFRLLLEYLELPVIRGEIVSISQILSSDYKHLALRYGRQWVIQLSDSLGAGGNTTYFVRQPNDWKSIKTTLKQLVLSQKIQEVNITKYLGKFLPATVVGCVTQHGVLVSPVWTQIIDQVKSWGEPDHGKFNGNDWSYHQYSASIQAKVIGYVQRVGEHMQSQGYKGIFGMDLLIDEERQQVYGVECNARFTGSFPVYTWLQLLRGETPIEVFHFLEWLKIPCQVDIAKQMSLWQQPMDASQLILVNPYRDHWVQVQGNVSAGTYRYSGNSLTRVGDEFNLTKIKKPDQFIWGSNTPIPGDLITPGSRIGKLYFPFGILDGNRQIKDSVQEVVQAVYAQLELKPTPEPIWDRTKNQWTGYTKTI